VALAHRLHGFGESHHRTGDPLLQSRRDGEPGEGGARPAPRLSRRLEISRAPPSPNRPSNTTRPTGDAHRRSGRSLRPCAKTTPRRTSLPEAEETKSRVRRTPEPVSASRIRPAARSRIGDVCMMAMDRRRHRRVGDRLRRRPPRSSTPPPWRRWIAGHGALGLMRAIPPGEDGGHQSHRNPHRRQHQHGQFRANRSPRRSSTVNRLNQVEPTPRGHPSGVTGINDSRFNDAAHQGAEAFKKCQFTRTIRDHSSTCCRTL